MRAFQSVVPVTCLILLGAVVRAQQPIESASISGTIVNDITGDPISGVTVRNFAVVVKTNDAGRFVWAGAKPGRVSLNFEHGRYVPRNLTYTIGTGEQMRDLVVRLLPLGVASGRVVDGQGRPAANVTVFPLYHRTESDGNYELTGSSGGVTNDRGEYRIFNLAPGQYFINFSSPSRGIKTNPAEPSLSMPLPGAITPILYPGVGRLANADLVRVRPGEESQLRTVVLSETRLGAIHLVLTNPAGELAKDITFGLRNRIVSINIGEGGAVGVTRWGSVVDAGGQSGKPALHLDSGTRLDRTYWPNLQGTYEAVASWQDARGASVNIRSVFEFDGSDVQLSMVLKQPEGKLQVSATLEASDGSVSPLAGADVDLGRPAPHREFVSSVPPGTMQRAGLLTRQQSETYRTGQDGKVSVTGIAAGQYHLYDLGGLPQGSYIVAVRQGERNALLDGITVSSHSEPSVDIVVRHGGAVVRGNVIDLRGGPAHDAVVSLLPDSPLDKSKLITLRRAARADQSGSFEFSGVAPGAYRLFAWQDLLLDLPNYPHLDPMFLKRFENRGTPVVVTKESEQRSVELTVLEAP